MNLRDAVSFNLKRLRKERGMSQAAFAEVLGIGFRALQTYELKEREPKEDQRKKMAENLGISELDFYKLPEQEISIEKVVPINKASVSKMINMLARHADFFERLTMMDLDSVMWEGMEFDLKTELEYQESELIKKEQASKVKKA